MQGQVTAEERLLKAGGSPLSSMSSENRRRVTTDSPAQGGLNGKEVGSLQGGRAKPAGGMRLLRPHDAAHQSGACQEAVRNRYPNDSRHRPEARLPPPDKGVRVHFLC